MVLVFLKRSKNVYWHAVSRHGIVGDLVAESNGRCTNSLAMAEMTTLATALYRKYSTSLKPSFQGISPGATSRFEVLSDATHSKVAVCSRVSDGV